MAGAVRNGRGRLGLTMHDAGPDVLHPLPANHRRAVSADRKSRRFVSSRDARV